MKHLTQPTRYLFFTGKGGVGKTTLATSTALNLADQGKKILLVSTDPASNLDEVLQTPLEDTPTSIPGVHGLQALNIDPQQAAQKYREERVGPYRGVLPDSVVRTMEEQLSGACTVEIAAFDHFTRLLSDPTLPFDHILFDTAPTGHTLRLLSLPAAWTGHLEDNPRGGSCLGPRSGLEEQKQHFQQALTHLQNPELTTVVLVTRPERLPVQELLRTHRELKAQGLTHQQVVVNGLLNVDGKEDPIKGLLLREQQFALDLLQDLPETVPVSHLPFRPQSLLGVQALRGFLTAPEVGPGPACTETPLVDVQGFEDLLDDLEQHGPHLILTLGKGGVGKTWTATRLALGLARRGHPVHLTTTDPAAHLRLVLPEHLPGTLTVSEIQPEVEVRRYQQEVVKRQQGKLTEDALQLLQEDLQSPCTEEVAVFHAFSRVIREARTRYVVVDTAPTGHTLLLLDTTHSYHREIKKNLDGTTPFMKLQDPQFTRMLLVTSPETTPVSEAKQLQDDLRRAGIEPYGWVVNKTLQGSGTRDAVLLQKARLEQQVLERVKGLHSRVVEVPLDVASPEMPTGRM